MDIFGRPGLTFGLQIIKIYEYVVEKFNSIFCSYHVVVDWPNNDL